MTEYYAARVLFDYDPVTPDELCLRVGETVEVRVGDSGEEEEEGWLYGSDLRGRHGTFPANYVADLRPSTSCSGDYGGGGAVSSSATSFHGPGDVEHAGSMGASSVATSVDGTAVAEENYHEDDKSATLRYSKQDSNSAAYRPAAEATTTSSGDQGYDGVVTATGSVQGRNTSESSSTAATPQQPTANQYHAAAASGAELQGAVSSQLPDGWLCDVDESSGVTYYYTSDGRRSSWTRPVAAAAAAPDPSERSSERRGHDDGFTSASPSPTSAVSVCLPGRSVPRPNSLLLA